MRSTVEEIRPDRYVIARELLVDSATVVVIHHLDSTTERLTTPDAFAARLDVPDSLRARVAAAPLPIEARAPDAPGAAWDAPTTGLPLGTVLFYTMAMNVWRPEAYAAIRADTLGDATAPPSVTAAPSDAATPVARAAPAPTPSRPRTVTPARTPTPRPATTTRRAPAKHSKGHGGKGHGRSQKRKGW